MSCWSPSIPDTDIDLVFWSNVFAVKLQTSAVQISWFAEAIVLLKNDSLKKASPVIVKYQTSPVIVDCFPVFRLSFTVSCEALSVDTHMNVGVQLFLKLFFSQTLRFHSIPYMALKVTWISSSWVCRSSFAHFSSAILHCISASWRDSWACSFSCRAMIWAWRGWGFRLSQLLCWLRQYHRTPVYLLQVSYTCLRAYLLTYLVGCGIATANVTDSKREKVGESQGKGD